MHRSRVTLAAIAALGVLAAACGSDATFRPVGAASPSCVGIDMGGDAVAPAAGVKDGTRWLFRCDRPPVAFQQSSIKLADLVGNIQGLGTAGLKSTRGAAAVMLVEDDPEVPWGTHLRHAEPILFRAFVEGRAMGDWLILVTDVVVHAAKDPVPPTAYRWSRPEVAAFVSCGMPTSASGPCHETFWTSADQVVLAPAAGQPRGR